MVASLVLAVVALALSEHKRSELASNELRPHYPVPEREYCRLQRNRSWVLTNAFFS